MSNFLVGEVARISVTILDVDGGPVDPIDLILSIKAPDGTTLPANYIKDSTGNYHYDLPLDASGTYGYCWRSTGVSQGVAEGGIFVNKRQFEV